MNKKSIRRNIVQIFAITEKDVKISLRFKFNLILSYITPVFTIFMPLIIMGRIFDYRGDVGPWSPTNFAIYVYMAYNITLLKSLISKFPSSLRREKYWETLPALIIAPFRRINLVFGIFFSSLIITSLPFVIFNILCYTISPISPLTFLYILSMYLCISLIFSGIGIIFGVIAVSKEGYNGILKFILNLFFWFSCLSYPFYMYPEFIRKVLVLNPFYYMFEILRLSWIENNVILSISSHIFSFIIVLSGAIIVPAIGIYVFNKVYRKYGIVGY